MEAEVMEMALPSSLSVQERLEAVALAMASSKESERTFPLIVASVTIGAVLSELLLDTAVEKEERSVPLSV
jgi:hypothetical protein